MDDARETKEKNIVANKKEFVKDNLRISHNNTLWRLYRELSEEMISVEEFNNIYHMLR